MFCIDFSFFISIFFFISFISFDNTQKTIYRTAKKTAFHSPSLAVSVEISLSSQDSSVLLSSARLIMKESSCSSMK